MTTSDRFSAPLQDEPMCNKGTAAVLVSGSGDRGREPTPVALPAKPGDATPQEWAAAVRLTFATARSLSCLQGIPSHWLEAMRDAALGVPEPVGINGLTEAETSATASVMGLSDGAERRVEAAAAGLRWCHHCGEGVTDFCRGKSESCPMQFKKLRAAGLDTGISGEGGEE